MDLVINAVVWATAATVLSQAIAIGIMWWLGLPPKRLPHEIEDNQNTAVGATFFIIALITSTFIGVMTAAPEPADSTLGDLAWIGGGLILAFLYTFLAFWVAHRVMDPLEGENVYTYIKREIILEQNAALAFLLGGLMVAPFISVASQII
ncbi:MAG: hypothetical protein GYB66_08430 [Chloroflexi bacterium]|nr:hypothetical protein [Chloroflexota bacterium]